MGIGDQYDTFTLCAHLLQEWHHLGMHSDQMRDFLFKPLDIQPEFGTPVVDAIPLHGTGDACIAAGQLAMRIR